MYNVYSTKGNTVTNTRNPRNVYFINLCKVGGKNLPNLFNENAPMLDNKRQSSQNFHNTFVFIKISLKIT